MTQRRMRKMAALPTKHPVILVRLLTQSLPVFAMPEPLAPLKTQLIQGFPENYADQRNITTCGPIQGANEHPEIAARLHNCKHYRVPVEPIVPLAGTTKSEAKSILGSTGTCR